MSSPLPGNPVRGSKTGRPVMAILDLLGRRTTLRALWELSQSQEPLNFRELQKAADTNPAVLNARLKDLREALLVEHSSDGYQLTAKGEELLALLLPLNHWSNGWAELFLPDDDTA